MAKPHGSPDGGLLTPNEFGGSHNLLRIWNVANVAINLSQMVGEGLVEAYLSSNLNEEDKDTFKWMTNKIHKTRRECFGLFSGDSVAKDYIPRTLREAKIV